MRLEKYFAGINFRERSTKKRTFNMIFEISSSTKRKNFDRD